MGTTEIHAVLSDIAVCKHAVVKWMVCDDVGNNGLPPGGLMLPRETWRFVLPSPPRLTRGRTFRHPILVRWPHRRTSRSLLTWARSEECCRLQHLARSERYFGQSALGSRLILTFASAHLARMHYVSCDDYMKLNLVLDLNDFPTTKVFDLDGAGAVTRGLIRGCASMTEPDELESLLGDEEDDL